MLCVVDVDLWVLASIVSMFVGLAICHAQKLLEFKSYDSFITSSVGFVSGGLGIDKYLYRIRHVQLLISCPKFFCNYYYAFPLSPIVLLMTIARLIVGTVLDMGF